MGQPVNQAPNGFTQFVFAFAATSTVGALAGWTFNLIHPIGGAIFSAVQLATFAVSKALLDNIFDDTAQGKTLKYALSFFASIAVATFVTTDAGYTITLMSGIALSIGMVAVLFAIAFLVECCPCIKPLLGMQPDDQAQPEGGNPPGPPEYDDEEQPEGQPPQLFNGQPFQLNA